MQEEGVLVRFLLNPGLDGPVHNCVVRPDGAVFCRGEAYFGALGP